MTQPLAEFCPSFKQHVIDFPVHRDFFLVGGSVTTCNRKLVGIFWASNMYYDVLTASYQSYVAPPGAAGRIGIPNSHRPPYIVELYDNFVVKDSLDLVFAPSDDPLMESFRTNATGFDGPKPFELGGQLWMDFYAGREHRDLNFYMGRINGQHIVEVRALQPSGGRRGDEKNWMPDTRDDYLRFHYRLGTLIAVDGVETKVGRQDFANVNGGTQVVPFDGGGLAVVHDFHIGKRSPGRFYRHYFVKFDGNGAPLALSRPFCLIDTEKVEVVTGLTIHPDGERAVISHGPFLVEVSLDDIRAMPWDGSPQNKPAPIKPIQPRVRARPPVPRPQYGRIRHPGVRA